MTRVIVCVLAGMMLAVAAAPAVAHDVCPPWFRGSPLTVYAEWEFIDPYMYDEEPSDMYWIGDGIHEFHPYCFTHNHPYDLYWEEDPTEPGDGRIYTGGMPGRCEFFVCNFIDDYPYKFIWVQITYGGEGVPYVLETFAPPWEAPIYGELIRVVPCVPGQRVESWVLPINPDREYVIVDIPPFTWVDQVIIETISTLYTPVEGKSWGSIKAMYR